MASEPAAPEQKITPEQAIRNELGPEGGFIGKSVDELEEESRTDHLTGLLNRRGFDEQLEKAYTRAKRTGDKLQIIFIDADKFKEVNKKYSRPGGDKVLVTIGEGMKASFRSYDDLARWGGDEFVAIVQEEPFKKIIDEEERQKTLNENIKKLTPEGFDANDINVTIGVVTWDGVSSLEDLQKQVHDHMDQRK